MLSQGMGLASSNIGQKRHSSKRTLLNSGGSSNGTRQSKIPAAPIKSKQ